ncbi:MAG TPA: hypothetical protein VGB18_04690 [Candidatus Thermoplasmatota archaeon]
MLVRGKELRLRGHAQDGMNAERPPIDMADMIHALQEPDHDDGATAIKRVARRTVIVRYDEDETWIVVRSVSATRRPLSP